ncbi:short-chain dehydrogenase/reductase [Geothrix oryzae]|uniref:Short-chain dehydrogenase/reductase n=1 Tax=Geothrix oryzae TaxID=2927975 RepID=A0ABN6UWB6_9BACT|nr:SDR family oxidoreductase [Geothrix oryzae]BDU69054.1 short-chain dehydrogenase/reductase [Geothrix oryzae]
MRNWVLITGCSTGIGRALVPLCRGAGWGVVATARRPESLADLPPGEDLRVLPLDVTEDASVARAAATCADLRLKALVNNAGYGQVGPLELLRPEELRAQFETNVIGLHRVTNAFLPLLRRQPGARILQVASMLGRLSIPLAGPYNASKHAVVALAESLRLEVGREVAVVLVEPGAIRTAFRETLATAWGDLPERARGTRYEAVIGRYLALRKGQAERFAMDAEDCARQLLHALDAAHPPRRVVIGRDAFWVAKLKALLPVAWWEGLLRRQYGLD